MEKARGDGGKARENFQPIYKSLGALKGWKELKKSQQGEKMMQYY